MSNWKNKPSGIEECDLSNADFVIAMDETGIPSLKGLSNNVSNDKKWFTLTGICIEKASINTLAETVVNLKQTHWSHGEFQDKRVVFHSREIRKKQGPFNPKLIDYLKFRDDLNHLIEEVPIFVSSATINKAEHVKRYLYPDPVYPLAISFIFERLSMRMNFLHSNCVILLESRGTREDTNLLKIIVDLISFGSRYMPANKLSCIKGVYFNHKRTNDSEKSYWPLELADLISYRIHHYQVTGVKSDGFKSIEKKLIGYPTYIGKGLKIFPI